MKAERVVLDTNVLISAALSPLGKPFACLSWVLDHAALLTSRELLEELETRLARPKFDKYIDDARRRAFVAELSLSSCLSKFVGSYDAAEIRTMTNCWRSSLPAVRIVW
jgi:putative PIN family toxin of toxin-antitoxin system